MKNKAKKIMQTPEEYYGYTNKMLEGDFPTVEEPVSNPSSITTSVIRFKGAYYVQFGIGNQSFTLDLENSTREGAELLKSQIEHAFSMIQSNPDELRSAKEITNEQIKNECSKYFGITPDEKDVYDVDDIYLSWCEGAKWMREVLQSNTQQKEQPRMTAEEVLTKYSDGHYTQFKGYENILMAMEEYANQFKQ